MHGNLFPLITKNVISYDETFKEKWTAYGGTLITTSEGYAPTSLDDIRVTERNIPSFSERKVDSNNKNNIRDEPMAQQLSGVGRKITITIANQTLTLSFNETDAVTLTEEQISFIHQNIKANTTLLIEIQEGSYIEIVKWYYFWLLVNIPYGAKMHVYLTAVDAINIETATQSLALLFGFITSMLSKISLEAAAVSGLVTFLTAAIANDYGTIYNNDHNPDNSFDMWFDVTAYTCAIAIGIHSMVIDTPKYTWLATLVGAYIIGTKPQVYVPFCAWDPYFTKAISIIWYIGPDHSMYYEVKSASTGITFR
jgi:hypothetical protein